MQNSFFQQVYEVVRKIPKGKVATYGQIAQILGNPRMSRQVGWALHANPQPITTPCHRVVNRKGMLAPSFAFGGTDRQRELLECEGIKFTPSGIINLSKYCCQIEDFLD